MMPPRSHFEQERCVESLIIPVVLLVMLGLWGAFESGRKFRREFRQRGIAWADVCGAMEGGRGTLVVDTVWGPQRSLGHPAIWWLEAIPISGEDLAGHIETGGAARLVKCPGRMRNLQSLRRRFGPDRVVAHGWSVAAPLADARQ
jgi:hypothetical protein